MRSTDPRGEHRGINREPASTSSSGTISRAPHEPTRTPFPVMDPKGTGSPCRSQTVVSPCDSVFFNASKTMPSARRRHNHAPSEGGTHRGSDRRTLVFGLEGRHSVGLVARKFVQQVNAGVMGSAQRNSGLPALRAPISNR